MDFEKIIEYQLRSHATEAKVNYNKHVADTVKRELERKDWLKDFTARKPKYDYLILTDTSQENDLALIVEEDGNLTIRTKIMYKVEITRKRRRRLPTAKHKTLVQELKQVWKAGSNG